MFKKAIDLKHGDKVTLPSGKVKTVERIQGCKNPTRVVVVYQCGFWTIPDQHAQQQMAA